VQIENFKRLAYNYHATEIEGMLTLIDNIDRTTSTGIPRRAARTTRHMGVSNMIVDTKITRGFDYYTGMVFEVFDTHGENAAR